MRLLRKHRDTAGLSCFLPAILLCGMAVGPATLTSPWLFAPYLGGLGFYFLVVFGFSLGLAWKAREIRLLPWLTLVFATVHLAAGAGLLHELMRSGFSWLNNTFVRPASPTEKPIEILALRTRNVSEESGLEPNRQFPQSIAG